MNDSKDQDAKLYIEGYINIFQCGNDEISISLYRSIQHTSADTPYNRQIIKNNSPVANLNLQCIISYLRDNNALNSATFIKASNIKFTGTCSPYSLVQLLSFFTDCEKYDSVKKEERTRELINAAYLAQNHFEKFYNGLFELWCLHTNYGVLVYDNYVKLIMKHLHYSQSIAKIIFNMYQRDLLTDEIVQFLDEQPHHSVKIIEAIEMVYEFVNKDIKNSKNQDNKSDEEINNENNKENENEENENKDNENNENEMNDTKQEDKDEDKDEDLKDKLFSLVKNRNSVIKLLFQYPCSSFDIATSFKILYNTEWFNQDLFQQLVSKIFINPSICNTIIKLSFGNYIGIDKIKLQLLLNYPSEFNEFITVVINNNKGETRFIIRTVVQKNIENNVNNNTKNDIENNNRENDIKNDLKNNANNKEINIPYAYLLPTFLNILNKHASLMFHMAFENYRQQYQQAYNVVDVILNEFHFPGALIHLILSNIDDFSDDKSTIKNTCYQSFFDQVEKKMQQMQDNFEATHQIILKEEANEMKTREIYNTSNLTVANINNSVLSLNKSIN